MNSREAFEQWAVEVCDYCMDAGADGDYLSDDTYDAWLCWKAATDRAAKIVSEEGPVIGSAGVAVVVAKILEGNE